MTVSMSGLICSWEARIMNQVGDEDEEEDMGRLIVTYSSSFKQEYGNLIIPSSCNRPSACLIPSQCRFIIRQRRRRS